MNDIRVDFFLNGKQINLHRTSFPPSVGDLVEFVTGDSVDNTPVYRVARRIWGMQELEPRYMYVDKIMVATAHLRMLVSTAE